MLERQRCRETCRSRDMWGSVLSGSLTLIISLNP